MPRKEVTINVPFPAVLDADGNGFSFFNDDHLSGSIYAGEAKARKWLRGAAAEQIGQALKDAATRQTLIFCKDGEVLLVNSRYGHYGYSIFRAESSGGAVSGFDTYEATLEKARNHAAECYGGVIGECRA